MDVELMIIKIKAKTWLLDMALKNHNSFLCNCKVIQS